MEEIKVFLGMEVGRYDGYEFGKVIKTYRNGDKLVFINLDDDDDEEAWDSLYIAKADDRFGWYAVDEIAVRVEFGNFDLGTFTKNTRFK